MWPDELIGIDFSGDARQWRRTSNRSNVWIATGRASGSELYVTGLCTVQELPGTNRPFDRLCEFIANASSSYAAIDAPFSVPRSIAKDVEAVWKQVLELPKNDQPFARGGANAGGDKPQNVGGAKRLANALRAAVGRSATERSSSARTRAWASPASARRNARVLRGRLASLT